MGDARSNATTGGSGDLVAHLAVAADAAGVGEKDAWLAGDVGADVPGVRTREERLVRFLVDVLHPFQFRRPVGLDRRETPIEQVVHASDDPLDMLLYADDHVDQH